MEFSRDSPDFIPFLRAQTQKSSSLDPQIPRRLGVIGLFPNNWWNSIRKRQKKITCKLHLYRGLSPNLPANTLSQSDFLISEWLHNARRHLKSKEAQQNLSFVLHVGDGRIGFPSTKMILLCWPFMGPLNPKPFF